MLSLAFMTLYRLAGLLYLGSERTVNSLTEVDGVGEMAGEPGIGVAVEEHACSNQDRQRMTMFLERNSQQVMAGGLPLLDNRVVHTCLELLPKAPAS